MPSDAMSTLMKYHWPGNVRELESIIRRYSLNGNKDVIFSLLKSNNHAEKMSTSNNGSLLNQNEIQTILAVLTEARWNQRRAAKILGISYSALRRRIDKYGLKG